jgi:predicted porin
MMEGNMTNKDGVKVNRRWRYYQCGGLAISLVVAGTIAPAMAADYKAPPKPVEFSPAEIPPLTYAGVTIYGNIDIAAQYETNGAPFSGTAYSSPSMIVPQGRRHQFVVAPNQEAPSFVGVRVEREFALGTSFVAKAETAFVPTTGALADALKTLQNSNGVALANQNFSFDAARAGQALNGQVYAGVSHQTFGTLTGGRQYTPMLDEYLRYDPLSSYGFSLFGFSGLASGQGSSETPIMDSSIKYTNKIGPVRVAALYARPETNAKDLVQVSGGFDWKGFSVDAIYGKSHDQVSASSLSAATLAANPAASTQLGARVFDSEG